MADEADLVSDREEREREIMRKYTPPIAEIPKGNGCCQWCRENISGPGRWCGPECRDADEKYK